MALESGAETEVFIRYKRNAHDGQKDRSVFPAFQSAIKLFSFTLAGLALASCTSTSLTPTKKPQTSLQPQAPAVAAGPVQIDIARLPGNYGLASYQRAQDRERTLKQAKIACRNPFVIKAGSNGGVVMHSAGQSGPTEVFLKTDAQGISYLGPKGAAKVPKDQRILSYDNGILITEFLQPRLKSVYGNIVLSPCT